MINFLVVGTQRTGSSALAELMGLHPDVVCGWESTQETVVYEKIRVAEEVLAGNFSSLEASERSYLESVYNDSKKALGFRRLFRSSNKWLLHPRFAPALHVDRLEPHIEWLKRKRNDIRIVHIVRVDNLAWLKSMGLSKTSGLFFGQKYPDETQFQWNLATAEKRVRSKHWAGSRLATLSQTNPYLRIEYEQFRSNNQKSVNAVLRFLDCDEKYSPRNEAQSKIQSSNATEQPFTNLEEVRAHLEQRNLLQEMAS